MDFALSSYKVGFLLRLFRRILSSSCGFVNQEVRVAQSPHLRSWQERSCHKPLSLLNNAWAASCVSHSRSLRARQLLHGTFVGCGQLALS